MGWEGGYYGGTKTSSASETAGKESSTCISLLIKIGNKFAKLIGSTQHNDSSRTVQSSYVHTEIPTKPSRLPPQFSLRIVSEFIGINHSIGWYVK